MIREFIYKYYIDPIRYGQPYTLVDTLTYALILILCVYLVYRWLNAYQISIDREFIYALIPWVIFGGFLRVVEDTGVLGADLKILLTTPIIFFVIFIYVAIALMICWFLEKRLVIHDFKRYFGYIGLISAGLVLLYLIGFGLTHTQVSLRVVATILAFASVASGIVYVLLRYGLGWEYLSDRLYQLLIFGQLLDASATSYGIDLHDVPYVEQHVVGSALIALTGTAFVMFPLKLLVIIPGIYVLEIYRREDGSGIWYLIILAMIMVGMAPGIRDMTRMMLYV